MARQEFYFSDGPYLSVLKAMNAALVTPEAFIKLLGKPHTGKSRLCEMLCHFMRRKGHRVIYFDYAIESPDMLRSLMTRKLDLPDSANFARVLEDSLAGQEDNPVLVIFDDAHLMSDVTLLEIYRLAGIQQGSGRMLNIVLCGEPQLEDRLLARKELKQLLLHISHTFWLRPMDRETSLTFLRAYLQRAGLPGLQLDGAAQQYFYRATGGYPGQAAALSQAIAASRSAQAELSVLGKPELVALGQEANLSRPAGRMAAAGGPWGLLTPLAIVLMIASLGLIYSQLRQEADEALPAAEPVVESPFVAEPEPASSPTQEVAVSVPVLPSAPEPAASVPVVAEEPVSDSDLALVTAAEIGIDSAQLAEPDFELVADDDIAPVIEEAVAVAPEEPQPTEVAPVAEEEPPVEQTARDAVQAWLTAWQDQDVPGYLAAYHPDFESRYHSSREVWVADRSRIITNANGIRIGLTEFAVTEESPERLEAEFWISYESANYRDDTEKRLVLVPFESGWRILEEVNLQVRR